MKAFLDTSVLVASFFEDHPHHEPSFALYSSQRKSTACTAAHSLAEFYSTSTGMPGKRRTNPHEALQFLSAARERLVLITLGEAEYIDVLDAAAESGIAGGAIYDALIARCAMKAKAQAIYTWNVRHFQRFAEIADRVREP
ncbi:MAG TPA: PIN domain-containing protein [Rhizomicrobium sp.]